MRLTPLLLTAMAYASQAGAESELYLEVGAGRMWGAQKLERPVEWGMPPDTWSAPPPHATVEAGYSIGRTTIYVMHASSLASGDDRGIEVVGVKHRFVMRLP